MNVLVVLHTPRSPHSAVYIGYSQLADALAEVGHSLTVLTPGDFPLCRWLHPRWLPLLFPPLVAWRLGRRGAGSDLAVFHSYAGWLANLWPRRAFRSITAFHGLEPLDYRELATEMRRLGHPLRWPFRLVHGWLMPKLLRLTCRHSDAVLCLNQAERHYLEQHRWASSDRILVFRHGVASDFFLSRTYQPQPRQMLFVGQWLPRKGIHDLVDAFSAVAAQRPDVRLCCAGTLVEREEVRRSFPAECQARVDVYARATQAELVELYRQADLFVFPSLFEGFGRVLLEAMAAALPIVTTPVGIAPELLAPNITALFVPRRDAQALAGAIFNLLHDAGLRARLGQAAQVEAREFELTRSHAAMIATLASVAGVDS